MNIITQASPAAQGHAVDVARTNELDVKERYSRECHEKEKMGRDVSLSNIDSPTIMAYLKGKRALSKWNPYVSDWNWPCPVKTSWWDVWPCQSGSHLPIGGSIDTLRKLIKPFVDRNLSPDVVLRTKTEEFAQNLFQVLNSKNSSFLEDSDLLVASCVLEGMVKQLPSNSFEAVVPLFQFLNVIGSKIVEEPAPVEDTCALIHRFCQIFPARTFIACVKTCKVPNPKLSDVVDFSNLREQSKFLSIVGRVSSSAKDESSSAKWVSIGEEVGDKALDILRAVIPPPFNYLVDLGVLVYRVVKQYVMTRPLAKELHPLYNLTEQVAKLDQCSLIGRDGIVSSIRGLLKDRKPVILVGESRVGKTLILLEVVRQLSLDEESSKKCVFGGPAALFLTTGQVLGSGEQGSLQKIIEVVKKNENVVLSIEEMHLLLKDKQKAELLRSALGSSQGGIKYFIGATTPEEYKNIEKDEALAKQLQKIEVGEVYAEYLPLILRSEARTMDPRFVFSEEAIKKVAESNNLHKSINVLTRITQKKLLEFIRCPAESYKEKTSLQYQQISNTVFDYSHTRFEGAEDVERKKKMILTLEADLKRYDKLLIIEKKQREELLHLAQLRYDLKRENVFNSAMLLAFFEKHKVTKGLHREERADLQVMFNKHVLINHFFLPDVVKRIEKKEEEITAHLVREYNVSKGFHVDIDGYFVQEVLS